MDRFSYFAVVDEGHILLVDHINAQLWLPTGGHVEPGEHPRTTALREAKEELSIDGVFLNDKPLFLTITETVEKAAGHTDVSICYALRGDRTALLARIAKLPASDGRDRLRGRCRGGDRSR